MKQVNEKKILVTGATGFIGSHLVAELHNKGYKIRVLVRKTSKIQRLKEMGVELFYGDIKDEKSLEGVADDIDMVFHLAAQVDRPGIAFEEYEKTNVEGVRNIVKACLPGKIKKFVFYSSIAAMGIRDIGKVDEKTSLKPNIPYGKSKEKIEKILFSYYEKYDFPLVILRPPTVYGPGEKYNFLTLCKTIKNGSFMIIGKGNNLMDFCWVGNLVQATILAGERGKNGNVYLVTDAKAYSMNEVVQTIAEIEGAKLPRFHLPIWWAYLAGYVLAGLGKIFRFYPPLFPNRVRTMTSNFYFDISKARKDLDYIPEDGFKEFAKTTIDYYIKNNQL